MILCVPKKGITPCVSLIIAQLGLRLYMASDGITCIVSFLQYY